MQKIELIAKNNQFVVDEILSQKPNLNFSILQKLLRKKDIRINNKKICQNTLTKTGDEIYLFLEDKQKKQVEVVFENKEIAIVFKPQGMEVTKKDKVFCESDCLEDLFDGFYACHRLDKNTEGLVVLAKDKKIQQLMFDVFKQHKVKKFYKAIVVGNVKQFGENLIDYHKKEKEKVKIYSDPTSGGSKIKTNYTVKKREEDLFLLDIELLTGKTHQIRAQLAHHGIFVVGDERYGKKDVNKKYHTRKQLLCASKLQFVEMPKELCKMDNLVVTAEPTFLKKYGF